MRHLTIGLIVLFICSCYAAEWSVDPASGLVGDEKKAWGVFYEAVKYLQDEGDRNRAAKLFEKVSTEFPNSAYAKDSKELAELLREMVKEDELWRESPDPALLPLEQKIAYHVHHLRNVNCYQVSQPGMCYVLSDLGQKEPGITNAAMKLKEIGEPTIPTLIELLADRRPIRSVGYWRDFRPSRTVLRYQDAAIQILDELVPAPFYSRSSTSAYFSTEKPEVREKVITSIKSWYRKSRGRTETERKWLAVEESPGIYQLIGLLESLALEPGQKDRVLAKSRELTIQRDPLQLPQISYLMCQLGDCGNVERVTSAYIKGNYDVGTRLPDDSAAGSNAESYVLRQVILYGSEAQRKAVGKNPNLKDDPLRKKEAFFNALVDLATDRDLPRTYDRAQFPIQMLVDALTSKREWSTATRGSVHWTIRQCDAAAGAIQKFTGEEFGFNEEKGDREKDEAIKRILSWWKKRTTSGQ